MAVDVYYFLASPPSVSVLMLAKYLGVHLNLKHLNVIAGEQYTPEFLKINPRHTVPAIEDNGFTLYESPSVMIYFVMKYAKNDDLFPKEPEKRAVILQRLFFTLDIFGNLREHFVPLFSGQAPNPMYMKNIEKSVMAMDGFVTTKFIAGDELSVADFLALAIIHAVKMNGLDIGRYDNVNRWYEDCAKKLAKYGLDDFTKALVEFFQSLPQAPPK